MIVAYKQAKFNQNVAASAAGVAAALDDPTLPGSLLVATVAGWRSSNVAPIETITDTYGNAWTLAVSVHNTGTNSTAYIFYSFLAAAGAGHSITCTPDSSAFTSIAVSEYLNADPGVAPLTNSGVGATTTGNSGNVTTTSEGCLFVGALTEDTGVTAAPTSDFHSIFDVVTGQDLHASYKIGHAQTTAATWSLPGEASSWAGCIAAFAALPDSARPEVATQVYVPMRV